MTSHNSTAGLQVVLQRKYERIHVGFKSFCHYLAMSDLNRFVTIWLCHTRSCTCSTSCMNGVIYTGLCHNDVSPLQLWCHTFITNAGYCAWTGSSVVTSMCRHIYIAMTSRLLLKEYGTAVPAHGSYKLFSPKFTTTFHYFQDLLFFFFNKHLIYSTLTHPRWSVCSFHFTVQMSKYCHFTIIIYTW